MATTKIVLPPTPTPPLLPRLRKKRRRRKIGARSMRKCHPTFSRNLHGSHCLHRLSNLRKGDYHLELLRYWDLSGEKSDTVTFAFCEYTPPPSSIIYHHRHCHGQHQRYHHRKGNTATRSPYYLIAITHRALACARHPHNRTSIIPQHTRTRTHHPFNFFFVASLWFHTNTPRYRPPSDVVFVPDI